MALLEPDAAIGNAYSENPASAALIRQRMWQFANDQSSPLPLWQAAFHANAIGWTLHMQGRGWLESRWYREIEAPLDSCWLLGAMISSGGRSIAYVSLSRPRITRPFTVDDVQRFDPLRPWLAHAFRRSMPEGARPEPPGQAAAVGGPVLSGQMIATADAKIIFETESLDYLLRILA